MLQQIYRLRRVGVDVEQVRLQRRKLLEARVDFVLRFLVRLAGLQMRGREQRPVPLGVRSDGMITLPDAVGSHKGPLQLVGAFPPLV